MSLQEHIDNHQSKWLVGLLLLFALAVVGYWNWSATPQLKYDAEVLKSLDALFTAMTSRDPQTLQTCKRKFESQVESGQIPVAAASRLRLLIQEAEQERWEEASQGLYDFILGQRPS